MHEVLEQIRGFGLIPIVTIKNKDDVRPLLRALIAAGLGLIEITFRTPQAEDAIRIACEEFPGVLVGAGTVLTAEQVEKVIAAGARFILTPGYNPEVVACCREAGIPVVPGINSPTQIDQACADGIRVLKFFPAEASGGVELLKSMAAPFPDVLFVPTGGITNANLSSYFSYERVIACGGSWIAPERLFASGGSEKITAIVRTAIRTMLGCRISSVRLAGTGGDTEAAAAIFDTILPVETAGGTVSLDNIIGIAGPHESAADDIIVSTRNLKRTAFYLEKNGVGLVEGGASPDDGRTRAFTLKKKFAGLSITFQEENALP
ncbi:MAG: bifunctional 4-hydroxy-2-oxoglutarate aldolase/2-dehydro-3-deoxy-phosphogluconate aldolase [Spirochaetales bacterium]|nr:bifunctional 4-hydroxy-2-oxoglutarate aldolase/2-dehydro-3-deoxy-phosphogluconate aldolase [Spirochaetales bacterium]